MQAHEWCVGSQVPARSNTTNSLISVGLLSSLHHWSCLWASILRFFWMTFCFWMFLDRSLRMAFSQVCFLSKIIRWIKGTSSSNPLDYSLLYQARFHSRCIIRWAFQAWPKMWVIWVHLFLNVNITHPIILESLRRIQIPEYALWSYGVGRFVLIGPLPTLKNRHRIRLIRIQIYINVSRDISTFLTGLRRRMARSIWHSSPIELLYGSRFLLKFLFLWFKVSRHTNNVFLGRIKRKGSNARIIPPILRFESTIVMNPGFIVLVGVI